MSVCTWNTKWIWNAFSDRFWRLFPLKNLNYLSPGKLQDISLHFSGDKLNMFSAWCYKTITYILIAFIQRECVNICILSVACCLFKRTVFNFSHTNVAVGCIWLYCTWNWHSFLKAHKDVHKIWSYIASHYFLKHYWLSGVSYFHMFVSAEIRTLCTFLISNFCHVLNVVCFLLGNSLGLNFICRRFGTLCSIFIGTPAPGLHVGRCSLTCSVTRPTPTLSPSFYWLRPLLIQAFFPYEYPYIS